MTERFSEQEFIGAVHDLMREQPEFVYRTSETGACYYTPHDSQPGCLFGQALLRLGVPQSLLAKYDPDVDNHGFAIDNVLSDLAELSGEVEQWAHETQSRQDLGIPWGELEKFESRRGNFS